MSHEQVPDDPPRGVDVDPTLRPVDGASGAVNRKADSMTLSTPGFGADTPALATGPTINASHDQTCGWCLGAVAATEPITYTRESRWCHASCTTNEAEANVG
jgi:hypothetical protein